MGAAGLLGKRQGIERLAHRSWRRPCTVRCARDRRDEEQLFNDVTTMRWSVVIPVFNERAFLPRTLHSLARQTRRFRLVLVDNGSTDGCIKEARAIIEEAGIDAAIIHEPTPGQVHALQTGIAEAAGEFVAICDADTWYPQEYLERAERLFDRYGSGCVATSAYLLPEKQDGAWARWRAFHQLAAMTLLPLQNHTSGAGHCYRLKALRAAGSYDAKLWPYVVKDHELMHRLLLRGRQAFARDFWCVPSERRENRTGVRWTLSERILYHLTPFRLKTRFFGQFLGPRFAARRLGDTVLRQQPWARNR